MPSRSKAIVASPAETALELPQFEQRLLTFIGERGLPSANVFVGTTERLRVLSNIEYVVAKLDPARAAESTYISKFIAAAAAGLFDAALNYLWDETIFELRRRVASYDLPYFFDIAVKDADRRKKLKDANDLQKVQDSELIEAANEIGLVSDLGLKHLDLIRYMRNWASAAHPNQNQITGLQLASWLDTCIVEVITLPQSTVVGEIKRLLANIRTTPFKASDATSIAAFFGNLDRDRAHALFSGFFGLYVDPASVPHIRQNIHLLAPRLWPQIDEAQRHQFGVRYAQYIAGGDTQRGTLARQFLEQIGALAYLPDDLRSVEIQAAIDDLLSARHALNNFHTEPALARRLGTLVGTPARVPSAIMEPYVHAVVELFLTNGHGVPHNAEPIYRRLVSEFDTQQALQAVLSFENKVIRNKLQFHLCHTRYRELLGIVRASIAAPVVLDLIDAIVRIPGALDVLDVETTIKIKTQSVRTVLGLPKRTA